MTAGEAPRGRTPTLIILIGLVACVLWLSRGLSGNVEPPSPWTDVEVLIEEGTSLGPEAALLQDGWQASEGVPNFGLRSETFWFRRGVDPDSPIPVRRWLELTYPILDSVELWTVRDGAIRQRFTTGDALPFEERPLRHRNFVFPLELEPGKTTILLRVRTDGVVQVPLRLWEAQGFIEHTEARTFLDGGFFGVLFVMAFYNLILFLGLREQTFLYYVGHVVTTGLFMATMSGLAFMHLWPKVVWWQAHAVPVLVSLSVVFISLFATAFLEIERRSAFGRVYTALFVLAVMASAASFILGPTIALMLASLLSVSALTVSFAASLWGWWRGNRAARFLVIAWGGFILGSLALAFNKLGLLPSNPWTENGMLFGSMLDVIFLSLAISERIRQERLLREAVQERNMQLEQEARTGLEQAVAERTEQLEVAMDQLSRANRRLEELSNVDGLTGVFNRRHFEETLERRWSEAAQAGGSLALLMVDVDRFKDVNDTYGHLSGDAVLRRLVEALKDAVGSRDSVCARLGGDEFVVLLDADAEAASAVAEAVRSAVNGLEVHDHGQVVRATVSIGVAVSDPREEPAEAALARADRALYQAKEHGRNRVVLDRVMLESVVLERGRGH